MKPLLAAAVFLSLAPGLAFGQARTDQTPGPEVRKLGYYLGTWKGEGETKGGPFGAAGKLSSTMTCAWFAGGFHMVCRGEEKGPTGKRPFLNILGYDREMKAYTEYAISGLGESEYDRGGTFAGNKLTFLIDENSGGKPVKIRYSEMQVSPVLYTYEAEVSADGKPWMVIAQGKIAKVRK
jgi:hypothetical protein